MKVSVLVLCTVSVVKTVVAVEAVMVAVTMIVPPSLVLVGSEVMVSVTVLVKVTVSVSVTLEFPLHVVANSSNTVEYQVVSMSTNGEVPLTNAIVASTSCTFMEPLTIVLVLV